MGVTARRGVGGRGAIDFGAVAAGVDLGRLIEADRGPPLRGRRWACPFHPGATNPNFGIGPDGRYWRCWSCGLSGDAVDYIARRDRITVAAAARNLNPFAPGPTPRPRRGPRSPAPAPRPEAALGAWADAGWQRAVDA